MDNDDERSKASRSSESVSDHLKSGSESPKGIEKENYPEEYGGRSMALDGTESRPGNESRTVETPLIPTVEDIVEAEREGRPYPPEAVQASMTIVEQRHHKGPLPDPDTLAKYAQIKPDLPERIMRMAEKDHDAVIEITKYQSMAEANAIIRLTTSYAILPYALILVTIFLFVKGFDTAGILSLVGTVGVALPNIIKSIRGENSSNTSDSE